MKILAILLLFFFASCLGQMSFEDGVPGGNGNRFSPVSQGQFLTLYTDEGFVWITSDQIPANSENYATLICVSSGSTTDTGLAERGSFESYKKGSQVMPLVGTNTDLQTDNYVFYAPSKPARGNGQNFGISPIYNVGDTIHFSVVSNEITTTINGQSTNQFSLGSSNYGFSFEVLNCGTAVWCLQDATQYSASPGDCEPGSPAPTCPDRTTCANLQDETDCSTATTFLINDYSCFAQCPSGTQSFEVKSGVNVCGSCANPCSSCSETATTCTSCIANYYLYQDTCVSSCPSGYKADTSSAECKKSATTTSQSFAAWKLSLAIGLPVVGILGIFVFLYMKLRAKAAQKKMTGENFKYLPLKPTSSTKETVQTQV